MIIQAELRRKQSEYEGEACAVDKVIELPAQRFQQFSRVLLADYDFIAENLLKSQALIKKSYRQKKSIAKQRRQNGTLGRLK